MGKPLGMTPMFQIVRPTPTEDAIWEAVEAAHAEGMTVEQFRRECAFAWGESLRNQAEDDAKVWEVP